MAKPHLNPTLIGSLAVLVWGLALPVARYVEAQIGIVPYIGTLFAATAALGFALHKARGEPFLPAGVFRNRLFYLRWLLFLGNMLCIMVAVAIVQKRNVPFVILLNYLWPTFTILFSVMFAGVMIRKTVAFIAGIVIVIAALSIEILQPDTLSAEMFSTFNDGLGYCLAMTAALCWGSYSALTRRDGHATGGSRVIPLFQSTLALALPVSFLPGMATWSHMNPALAVILGLWCVMQFGAFQVWDLGIRQGNIVILSLCADFIPWLSLATSQFLLGVDIGHRTVASAILLVIGAMTVRYGTSLMPAHKNPSEPELAMVSLPESPD